MLDKYILVAAAHFLGVAVTFKLLDCALPESITSYFHWTANIFLFAIVSWQSFILTKKTFLKDQIIPHNKAVLITGCDSGFGHNLAKRLDSKGFNVFATCLFPSGIGAEELRKSCTSRLRIVELDVTSDASVQNAVAYVEKHLDLSELWAIVNNAGIGKGLSVDISNLQDFKDCMEVNVFGVIRVTKAFLPLLKKSKGRIVNITSIAGRVCVPHVSPYIVSKYAAVGLSDSLRQELVDLDISVISVEPELFQTGLTSSANANNNLKNTFDAVSENLQLEYDGEYQKQFRKSQDMFLSTASSNIQVVIDDLDSAVTLQYPEVVYNPRRNHFFRFILYMFIIFPIPIRDFCVKVALCLLRYKKPNTVPNK